jgi:hypothetical protein
MLPVGGSHRSDTPVQPTVGRRLGGAFLEAARPSIRAYSAPALILPPDQAEYDARSASPTGRARDACHEQRVRVGA